ncbi:heat shock-related 70 kDa protein 2-like [Rhynchophorus ferrugineus]|uniref:heat shock-related 70 kDa protein 2-like n=1 Tax=Rhynchophorus ferrugineus TaxID=354439 RepID=UPI003FCE7B1F
MGKCCKAPRCPVIIKSEKKAERKPSKKDNKHDARAVMKLELGAYASIKLFFLRKLSAYLPKINSPKTSLSTDTILGHIDLDYFTVLVHRIHRFIFKNFDCSCLERGFRSGIKVVELMLNTGDFHSFSTRLLFGLDVPPSTAQASSPDRGLPNISKVPAVGFDLGTSFSTVAVCLNGEPVAIPNREGKRIIPSVVSYNERNSTIWVGNADDNQSIDHPTGFLYDVKRFIGRKYKDAHVQEMKNSIHSRFKLTSGTDGSAVFELNHNGELTRKLPEAVSSEMLKYLRKLASQHLKADVREAVIAVPAHFGVAQRKATKEAAELAGLKVLRLITEPLAGALYYFREKSQIRGKVLVYDFGGGTFDVSIIDVNDKKYKVLNVEGDTFLGGRDMDNLVVKYFTDKLKAIYGESILTPKLMGRLKRKCVRLKEKLSVECDYFIELEHVGGHSDFRLSMTRREYEEIISGLVKKSMNIVKKCLRECNVAPEDITNVILLGGVTRTPMIRNKLREYFGVNKLRTDVNLDEGVALGAAYQAFLLTNQSKELEKTIVTEVAPTSLGLNVTKGFVKNIIKKGSILPTENNTKFATLYNHHNRMRFKIYEGERNMEKYNNYIGEFSCNNLPRGKAYEVKVEVSLILDHDGILQLKGNILSGSEKTILDVILQDCRLYQSEIDCKIEDTKKIRRDNDLFEAYINNYCCVKTFLNRFRTYNVYTSTGIHSTEDQEYIEGKVSELETYMEKIDHTTPFKEILQKYQAFQTCIENIAYINDQEFEIPLNRLKTAIQKFNQS